MVARLITIAALLAPAVTFAIPPEKVAVRNDDCFRCHGMTTLARRAATGEIESLAVMPGEFAHSEHHKLTCGRCHGASYQRFPHPAAAKKLECLQCHKDKPERKALFAAIGEEFRRSVHFQRHPKDFDCFRCHDPHQFHRWKEVSLLSIAQQNDVCLKCHASPQNYQRIARRPIPSLTQAHSWLPHADLHMEQVRCLDCHSSYEPPVRSHAILAKEQAVRDCVQCHAKNTVLRQKLYRYQRGREAAERGFVNAAVVNESYIIGATRNRVVDGAGAAVLGVTALAISGYGAAVSRSRRRPSSSMEDER